MIGQHKSRADLSESRVSAGAPNISTYSSDSYASASVAICPMYYTIRAALTCTGRTAHNSKSTT